MASWRATAKVELEELSAAERPMYESILDASPDKFKILSSDEAAMKMQASAAVYEAIKKERAERSRALEQAAAARRRSLRRGKGKRRGGDGPKSAAVQ